MNKEDIIRQLKIYDTDQIPKIKRVIDLFNQVKKNYEVICSDFVSPDILGYIEKISFNYPDGGHANHWD